MTAEHLRRYTSLPGVFFLLSKQKLTLIDAQSWDDANDSHFLELYRGKKNLKSVLALCFTETVERYHHWRVFASGSSGVCVRFDRAKLLEVMENRPGIRTGAVTYLKLADIRNRKMSVQDLPFLKRAAFKDECEFRIIYESKKSSKSKLDIDIPLSCITHITISPWLHPSLSDCIKGTLKAIRGCHKIPIGRSTLISNTEWKNRGDSAR